MCISKRLYEDDIEHGFHCVHGLFRRMMAVMLSATCIDQCELLEYCPQLLCVCTSWTWGFLPQGLDQVQLICETHYLGCLERFELYAREHCFSLPVGLVLNPEHITSQVSTNDGFLSLETTCRPLLRLWCWISRCVFFENNWIQCSWDVMM